MVSGLLKGHSIILGFLGAKWPQGLTFDAENKTQILTITQFWKSYHDRNIWTRSKLSKMPQNSFKVFVEIPRKLVSESGLLQMTEEMELLRIFFLRCFGT